jgi:hypothetical protein
MVAGFGSPCIALSLAIFCQPDHLYGTRYDTSTA